MKSINTDILLPDSLDNIGDNAFDLYSEDITDSEEEPSPRSPKRANITMRIKSSDNSREFRENLFKSNTKGIGIPKENIIIDAEFGIDTSTQWFKENKIIQPKIKKTEREDTITQVEILLDDNFSSEKIKLTKDGQNAELPELTLGSLTFTEKGSYTLQIESNFGNISEINFEIMGTIPPTTGPDDNSQDTQPAPPNTEVEKPGGQPEPPTGNEEKPEVQPTPPTEGEQKPETPSTPPTEGEQKPEAPSTPPATGDNNGQGTQPTPPTEGEQKPEDGSDSEDTEQKPSDSTPGNGDNNSDVKPPTDSGIADDNKGEEDKSDTITINTMNDLTSFLEKVTPDKELKVLKRVESTEFYHYFVQIIPKNKVSRNTNETVELKVAKNKELTEILDKNMTSEVPVIQANDVILEVGNKFDPLKYASATDKEDGDISSNIEIVSDNVDMSKAGKYSVTYKVEDKDGNVTLKTITVTVVDTTKAVEDKKDDKDTLLGSGNSSPKTGDKGIISYIGGLISSIGIFGLSLKRKKNK